MIFYDITEIVRPLDQYLHSRTDFDEEQLLFANRTNCFLIFLDQSYTKRMNLKNVKKLRFSNIGYLPDHPDNIGVTNIQHSLTIEYW